MNRRAALSLAGMAVVAVASPVAAKEDPTANKKVAQQYIDEVWNKQNLSLLDQIVSPDFKPSHADDAPGIDGLKQRLGQALQFNGFAVQHATYAVATMAAEGSYVFLRGDLKGTSSAGKKIDAPFFVELKFVNGLVVQEWSVTDQTALFGG
jgi:hypothetical protein